MSTYNLLNFVTWISKFFISRHDQSQFLHGFSLATFSTKVYDIIVLNFVIKIYLDAYIKIDFIIKKILPAFYFTLLNDLLNLIAVEPILSRQLSVVHMRTYFFFDGLSYNFTCTLGLPFNLQCKKMINFFQFEIFNQILTTENFRQFVVSSSQAVG